MAESRAAIYGAIGANVAIAVTKFVVAGITGSSAMLSEGIHSAVDTGNGVLLLVGTKLSERPPSPEHPFGHGKELYFWSLIVAVLIFGIGGGVSLFEGIQHIRHPEPMTDVRWNLIVLGAAVLFEGASFLVALRQFRRENSGRPFWQALRSSKDPTTYTVMAEDSAALLGLLVAFVGIGTSQWLHEPALDGAASAVIGLILAGVAILLVRESRGLLIGEGIRATTAHDIRALALAQPGVREAGWPLSMYIGRDEVLLTLELVFDEDVPVQQAAAATAALRRDVQARFPVIKRISVQPVTALAVKAPTPEDMPAPVAPL
ncbi:cation diffusion facilitator family transporter [Azohydromonas lata]|uniref:Cation diffusion facilitator family transporter n=1 Tax=Azohydromonas lata TaxID=45677 RepID=A0ABU5IHZ2_9BURK|nr:cation diffusion facilitator family transporter [Azohydromonas lata]MDZ5458773.1 cation diffusion facilitator family transporter [Azohydromonas lata]